MTNNYDNIGTSDKMEKGMRLSSDDRQFLKHLFDRQDEINAQEIEKLILLNKKEHEEIFKALSTIQTDIFFLKNRAEENSKEILLISSELVNTNKRVDKLYAKLKDDLHLDLD